MLNTYCPINRIGYSMWLKTGKYIAKTQIPCPKYLSCLYFAYLIVGLHAFNALNSCVLSIYFPFTGNYIWGFIFCKTMLSI